MIPCMFKVQWRCEMREARIQKRDVDILMCMMQSCGLRIKRVELKRTIDIAMASIQCESMKIAEKQSLVQQNTMSRGNLQTNPKEYGGRGKE